MWPTSMPRTISRVPWPSGLGSPATTLRMSPTSWGSGKSRPQLTPTRRVTTSQASTGAADEIAHDCYRAISVDRESCVADRSDVAGAALQYLFDFLFSCEAEFADRLLGLDLIQIVVATDEQHHEPPRRFLGGLVAYNGDCLHGFLDPYAKQGRDIFATGLIGGSDLSHFLRRSTSGNLRCYGLSELHIRRVLGLPAVSDGVLARFGEDVKFP